MTRRETICNKTPEFFVKQKNSTDGLRVWRNQDPYELWLLPSNLGEELRVTDVHSFAVRPTVVKQRLGGMVLKIHISLVAGMVSTINGEALNDVQLEDCVLAELAHGLWASEEERDTLIAEYLTGMLLIRIRSVLSQMSETMFRRFEDWQLQELQRIFADQIGQDASVAQAAARCRLSTCQFSRLFKSTYGMPLHKYLMGERVRLAQERLAGTQEPISQIALACGFADQSSFTRRFTSVSGVPPGHWRRQARRTGDWSPTHSTFMTVAEPISA